MERAVTNAGGGPRPAAAEGDLVTETVSES
jgi:hypothetical protein